MRLLMNGDYCDNDCCNCFGDKVHVFAKDNFTITGEMFKYEVEKGERFWIYSESRNRVILKNYIPNREFLFQKSEFEKYFSYQEESEE